MEPPFGGWFFPIKENLYKCHNQPLLCSFLNTNLFSQRCSIAQRELSSRTIIHGMGVASCDAISRRQLCESHYKLSLPILVADLSFFFFPNSPPEKKAFQQCGSVGGSGVVELCMEPVGRNL